MYEVVIERVPTVPQIAHFGTDDRMYGKGDLYTAWFYHTFMPDGDWSFTGTPWEILREIKRVARDAYEDEPLEVLFTGGGKPSRLYLVHRGGVQKV